MDEQTSLCAKWLRKSNFTFMWSSTWNACCTRVRLRSFIISMRNTVWTVIYLLVLIIFQHFRGSCWTFRNSELLAVHLSLVYQSNNWRYVVKELTDSTDCRLWEVIWRTKWLWYRSSHLKTLIPPYLYPLVLGGTFTDQSICFLIE